MKCIYCGSKTGVINSRLQKKTNQTWRRRQCSDCGAVFTTEEAVLTDHSVVVINKTHTEPFSRDRLLLSIYDSLKHRKTAITDATALLGTVWGQLYPNIESASLQRDNIVRT